MLARRLTFANGIIRSLLSAICGHIVPLIMSILPAAYCAPKYVWKAGDKSFTLFMLASSAAPIWPSHAASLIARRTIRIWPASNPVKMNWVPLPPGALVAAALRAFHWWRFVSSCEGMDKLSPGTSEGSPAARGAIPVLVPDGKMSALIRWRWSMKTMLEKKGFQCMM